jgi:hypothetical protein
MLFPFLSSENMMSGDHKKNWFKSNRLPVSIKEKGPSSGHMARHSNETFDSTFLPRGATYFLHLLQHLIFFLRVLSQQLHLLKHIHAFHSKGA